MSSTDEKFNEKDVEAGKEPTVIEDHPAVVIEEIHKTHHIQQSFTVLRKLREAELWMDRKLGGDGLVETQGVDRIPEEAKQPPSILNALLMWFSVTMHVGTVPLGYLGPEVFGLSFSASMSAVTIGICLGALLPAYTGLLGPKLGMRQIATSRYSFGFWGAKLCSVLNVVVGGGFAVVNVVVVGQILSAVSDFKMSIVVGCIIIGVISYFFSIFGFRLIHTYEKYSWMVAFVLFIVLYAQTGKHVDSSVSSYDSGIEGVGDWLSFMAIQFSSASGWCSIAADYYCNYPKTTSKAKIFGLTWAGLVIPTLFTTWLGVVLGNATFTAEYQPYYDAYYNGDHGFGGLLLAAWRPEGWAKFALVISIFTVCGNNIAVFYSSGLSLQLLGHYFHAIPRFIWSFLCALVVVILAIAGRESLSTIVSNFVSMLGYWAVCFTFILMIEDLWFRRRDGYDLHAWDQPEKLPPGAAAVFTLLAGYCAGGVPGMSQTWYVGPVAAKFGPYGGDVGIYLSFAITVLVYPIARTIEKKYTGR
ncbi:putative cytosine permease [Phaeomoniella chlamydospora]|uniref:Putative cytosine permease n=1 Tax=Phaeomoniella chlamydospora TaxID=158046 RepID=A0A0G2EPT1_PHACM|nr:putative cytosine permease [Phaeomoniella chlamydospora]